MMQSLTFGVRSRLLVVLIMCWISSSTLLADSETVASFVRKENNEDTKIDIDGNPEEKVPNFICQQVHKNLVCELIIPNKEDKQSHALKHCEGAICIQVALHITPSQQIVTTITATTIGFDDKSLQTAILQIGSQKYSPPYSQYGMAVERALTRKPSHIQSVEFADWLVWDLAAAYQSDDMTHASQEQEVAIDLMQTAIDAYQTYQEQHPTEAIYTVSGLANAHMLIGEALLLVGRTMESIQHFTKAKDLYKSLLNQQDLHNQNRDDLLLSYADSLIRLSVTEVDHTMSVEEFQIPNDSKVMTNKLHSSEISMELAVSIYQDAVARGGPQKVRHQLQLANALQNFASTLIISSGDMNQVLKLQNEALAVYTELMQELDNETTHAIISEPDNQESIFMAVAELLYSMSDSALQAGKYSECNKRYSEAMEWYQTYHIKLPAAFLTTVLDNDEIVNEHERALADYQASVYGSHEVTLSNTLLMTDNLYEADLYATLGALKLTGKDFAMAYQHIQRAIDIYEWHGEEQAAADAHLNLALGLFHEGKFTESADAHKHAVDIYQHFVDKGKVPLTKGSANILIKAGMDIGKLTAELKAATTDLGNEGGQQGKNKKNVVHESLIDVGTLLQRQQNVTFENEM